MRKFYLLLVVALLATSSAFADITYVLNGGQPNPYGWNSKEDMFRAFMQVALEKTEVKELSAYLTDKENDPVTAIGGDLYDTDGTRINRGLSDSKFGWLKTYIMTFQNAQIAAGYDASELKETITASHQAYRFAVAAFFAEGKRSSAWPKSADFTEAGKDEAYLPAWEYCYAFPTTVTATTTLKTPWKKNCTFGGWYTTSDFSGTAVTKIEAGFTGTLYAKWINNVLYELNGGKWNPYDWTSKEDMYKAFMTAAGATNYKTLAEYVAMEKTKAGDGVNGMVGRLYDGTGKEAYITSALTDPKFTWLVAYLKSVETKLTLKDNFADSKTQYKFAACAFFISGESTHNVYPSSNYAEAGKDEAYFPAWGYSYGNPSIIEGEYTLKNPYREGAWEFAGWYDNAEFDGDPITTINADFAGTLYAKWNPIIKYELNGGSYGINNPYGWTSKEDLFNAFMEDAGVTLKYTYAQYTKMKDPYTSNSENGGNQGLGALLTSSNIGTPYAMKEKWGWLHEYIKSVAGLADISSSTSWSHTTNWRYATAQFLMAGKKDGNYSFDFTEAGKDENYCTATAWGHSYDLKSNPKEAVEGYTLNSPEKEGCTFQGWYDNRWFTGDAVTTLSATTTGTLYAHWSSIMGSDDKTLNTLHTHYYDGNYVYASTIENNGSNKSLYNIDKAGEYFSDKADNFNQEDWVAIKGLTDTDLNKEIAVGTAFTKVANADFPVIEIEAAAPQAASTIEVNNYRVANFNIGADNAHVNNVWLVAPQAGEYCHLTGYVKAVSGNVVTLAASDKEDDAVEMTVNIAKLSAKSAVVAGAWYKFTGIVVNGDKALTFNATSSEDVSTGVEEAEIGSTIVRGMNGEIAVSVASPATVNVYTAGGALVATRNIADSDAIAVAPGFYIVKADNTVVKVLVK